MRGQKRTGLLVSVLMLVGSAAAPTPAQARGLFLESQSRHGFSATVARLEAELKRRGWKIPAIHDLQASMRKLGHAVAPVKVLAACHPQHAVKILADDAARSAAAMMPCRIAVYRKKNGKTYISRPDVEAISPMLGRKVAKVMGDAGADIEAAIASVVRKKSR